MSGGVGGVTGAIPSPRPDREQLGDEARVGATLAVAHPESSTASFPSYEVACHALAASVPTQRGHRETGVGDGAPCGRDSAGDGAPYGRDSAGDDKRGRRQASPLREQLGDEARVGATLAVAHPESSTASFPSYEVACHALAASRTDPNEAIGKPVWATARPTGAIAWATTSVGDDKRRP